MIVRADEVRVGDFVWVDDPRRRWARMNPPPPSELAEVIRIEVGSGEVIFHTVNGRCSGPHSPDSTVYVEREGG